MSIHIESHALHQRHRQAHRNRQYSGDSSAEIPQYDDLTGVYYGVVETSSPQRAPSSLPPGLNGIKASDEAAPSASNTGRNKRPPLRSFTPEPEEIEADKDAAEGKAIFVA